MTNWNYADVWEKCAEVRQDARAQVQGNKVTSWTQFNQRANGIASAMLDAGLQQQDKVAQYLFNRPEYLESVFASFKASMVPVNTNYRYADKELVYLWTNSDAACVVFQGAFTDTIDRIRDELPGVKLWLWVDDGDGDCPEWATAYEAAAAAGTDENVQGPWGRSGSDLWFLYTGGTTGMPKGVMWKQDTLLQLTIRRIADVLGPDPDVDTIGRVVAAVPQAILLPGAPLMHGTGQVTALGALSLGGCVVCLESRSLDVPEMITTVERESVTSWVIVGDAFARPIADALDAEPDRWDLSKVEAMTSSGVMWSQPIKQRLLAHMPQLTINDALGSSEALGMASSTTTKDSRPNTAKFQLGDDAVVIRDDGELVAPGSGDIGRVGVQGLMPEGYYKDPEKSAATFPTINGVRYSLPGDFATIEADGTITLLGRGSVVINTGGEKVFPEEVEETLKTRPEIVDAIAVGIPSERFGQAVVAVVEPTPGADVDPEAIIAHVRDNLAAYKAPREVFVTPSLSRAANGKIDYKRWTAFAREQAGIEA